MAYNAHDLDDALKLELVSVDELRHVPLVDGILQDLQDQRGRQPSQELRTSLVRRLLDRQVSSLLTRCCSFLNDCGWSDPGDAVQSEFMIDMEPPVAEAQQMLAAFLSRRIYRHARLMEMRQRAQSEIQALFRYLTQHADMALPVRFAERARDVGVDRSVAEFIAGMTDRYCHEQFMRYLGNEIPSLPE